jgi:hypothetical protein
MRKALALAAVSFAITVAASGQSNSRQVKPENAAAELIAMSRHYVAETQGGEVVDSGVLRPTPFGLMGALEIKAWLSAELERPVLSIKGEEAIVTGQVIYKRTDGSLMREAGSVRVYYVREGGHWKYAGLCLGDCG